MWLEYFAEAFLKHFPIFMIVITISGLVGAIQIGRIANGKQIPKERDFILGTGLFALFVGLLAFPIETFQMLQTMQAAGEYEPSIVMGGFYITFVPMFYGFFWFLILLSGWLYHKRKPAMT